VGEDTLITWVPDKPTRTWSCEPSRLSERLRLLESFLHLWERLERRVSQRYEAYRARGVTSGERGSGAAEALIAARSRPDTPAHAARRTRSTIRAW